MGSFLSNLFSSFPAAVPFCVTQKLLHCIWMQTPAAFSQPMAWFDFCSAPGIIISVLMWWNGRHRGLKSFEHRAGKPPA